MGHCRFLNKEHRFKLNRHLLSGTNELRYAPKPLSGSNIFKQVEVSMLHLENHYTL